MATRKTTRKTDLKGEMKLRQREAELAILQSVGEAMTKTLDIKTVTKIVGDKVRDIFSADQIGILLLEQQTNLLHLLYGYDKAHERYVDDVQIKPVPLGKGLTSKVIELRRPLLLGTREEQDGYGHYMPPELVGQIKMSESWLGVPIMVNENMLGVVFVEEYRPHAYNESHLRLLQTLSSNMGVAIQNARLFEETQQRNTELQIINSIQQGLASKLEIQSIYDLVGEKIHESFKEQAQIVFFAFYDPVTDLTDYPYVYQDGNVRQIKGWKPDTPIARRQIETPETIFIRTVEDVERYGMTSDYAHSAVFVPFLEGAELHGVVGVINQEREFVFTESDVRLLETLANSMSVALENARLFDETQQRAAELAVINSVQEGLASKLEMQAIYDLVGDKIREIFDANTVTLATFDLEKNLMHPYYAFEKGQRFSIEPLPIPEVYREFIQRAQPLLINNNLDEYIQRQDPNAKPLAGEMPKSVLAVPLIMNGALRGIVTLQNIDRENAFSESDTRLLQTLANSMSVALENARLWEQEKMFRKALQRELDIGREIQQGFLPEALPIVDGWEIAASLMSAREVAGDFYDAFELPDGAIGLVIADVCDKGVGAALFMTLFRSLIRAAANLDYFEQTEKADAPHSSEERLQRAVSLTNNYIAETHGESGMFATLFFGILDPRDGKLIYVNGGHESPLIVNAGKVRESLRKTGPAVGALANCKFGILETHLQAGDTFFAFTDGVPDCQNPKGEFFGRERMVALLSGDRYASETVNAMEVDLRQYIGSANQFDDITLLAVRRI